ncbi:dysbindin protein homolog [Coccinella septempunctata]|uniref:dysbindin protein homolog n=1 Tax=Coccinella septempunctata TaxID=41139 RepID=UPI001D07B3E1|nr:dysbindin protein homolog [Coccinella septempunctata]
MLSNIKSKFLNVSKNVIFPTNDQNEENPVNFEAGSEILDYFRNEWSILHNASENNAKKANEVAKEIESVYTKIKKTENDMEYIVETLTTSNLTNNINGAHQKINDLLDLCEKVEKGLIEFEKTIDEIEFQNMKKRHTYHLKKYEERKEENFKLLQSKLEQERKEELEKAERDKAKIMEERQKVFQEAFQNDLEIFKALGQIPKLELNKQPSALLEEIEIDYDTEELDQFFEDSHVK